VPGSLLDAERIVNPYRAPGDAGRAKVVERDVLAVQVAFEELGPGDLGRSKMLTQKDRAVLVVRHPQHVRDALAAGLCALGS
jgi:hypothetical protein